MKAAIIFVLFVSAIFAQTVILNIGGTTCIPDEAETCTPRTGSTRVTLAGGVSVNADNACVAGAADVDGVAVPLTVAADGFYNLNIKGLGAFKDGGSIAVLVYEGDVAEDPCEAAYVTSENEIGVFWPAGEYTVVVTSNSETVPCGEFTLTLTQTDYAMTANIDTEVAAITPYDGGCLEGEGTTWVAGVEWTPAESGSYNFIGVGRLEDVTTQISVAFITTTDLTTANVTNAAALCNASFVFYSVADLGYVVEADTTYWVFFQDVQTANRMDEQPIWFNAIMQVTSTEPAPEFVCDSIDYEDQANYMRPSIPSVSVTTECEEGTDEFHFDVRQTSFETDQFVVVDTISCPNGGNFDQAVVLYYGAVGTVREGAEPAVAPEDVCENFIIAGDSGDGGAVYYWFPANEDLTIVPTAYSSSGSGDYVLSLGSYDIVGCVPANPYLPEPEPADFSSSLVVFAFAVVMAALF